MVAMRDPAHDDNRRATNMRRAAFSLLELLAALALVGLLVGVSVRYAPDTMGNLSTKVDARRISLDLLHCRRAAIATGDNHVLVFETDGKRISSYTPFRRSEKGLVPVDSTRTVPDDVQVDVMPGDPEFTFEGTALASCTIELVASNRSSTITVSEATGAVAVSDK